MTIVHPPVSARATTLRKISTPHLVVNASVTFHVPIGASRGTFRFPGYSETDDLQDEFARLADEWHAETGHLSSPRQIATHPAYQRIIGLGDRVIPLILSDLRRRGGEWYWALRYITGQWPVPDDAAGDVRRMKEAWLRWGETLGHIDDSSSAV